MRLILAPLAEEIKRLRAMVQVDVTVHLQPGTLWCGRMGTHAVCLGQSGPGEAAVATLTEYALAHFPIRSALLIGFAGATATQVMAGDLVIADRFAGIDISHASAQSAAALLDIAEHSQLRAHRGTHVITTDVIAAPQDKAALGTQHRALAVATEGIAFARAADTRQIPWAVTRVIFDAVDSPLLFDCAVVTSDGNLAIGTLLQQLCKRPRSIMQLPRYYYGANAGCEVLTTFTKAWLAEPTIAMQTAS